MIRAAAFWVLLGWVLLATMGLPLAGRARTAAPPGENVTYLFPAPATLPAVGPWIVARQRGYYAAEGLAVNFETGKGGADVAKQVGVGNAVLGGGMGDTPIILRGNGVPIKSVAVLGNRGLTQLVVPADSPIQGPADLKGKIVNVTAFQETTYYATLGMLSAVGPAGIWQLFLAGKADAMSGVLDWIADVEQRGAKVRVIHTSAYFHSMGQAILASDSTIREHPDLVRKVVRATLHGMAGSSASRRSAVHPAVG